MWKRSGSQRSLYRLSYAAYFPATGTSLQMWDESQLQSKTQLIPDLAGGHLLDCHLWKSISSKQQTRLYLGKVNKPCRRRSCQRQLFCSLTLMLVFLPGAQLYSFENRWVKEKWIWRWRLACLFFPITLVCFKVGWPSTYLSYLLPILPKAALLLNPSPMMVGMNIRVTACEGIWESLLQLCLQFFIIYERSDTFPSLLQVTWQDIIDSQCPPP